MGGRRDDAGNNEGKGVLQVGVEIQAGLALHGWMERVEHVLNEDIRDIHEPV
jgi:hypothetical protein